MHTLDASLQLPPPRPTRLLPSVVHGFFEAQVAQRPDAVAVEFGEDSWTYAQLNAYANRLARELARRGVKPGDLVAIYLHKSPRLYGVILGILKAGAGYVPIDPRFPVDRIRAILEDSEARVVVSEAPLCAELDGAEIATPLLALDRDASEIAAQPSDALMAARDIAPETVCYVIYTSGSTGRPKGVMIEHRNAVAFVKTLRTVYQMTPQDRVYQGFSTAFDASVEEIWAALSIGGTLVVPPAHVERSPADAADFINAQAITYFSTVPTMLSMIDSDLPSVRTLVLGGEACSNELVARWAAPGRRFLNTYGPTEATVVATWAECVPGREVAIGRPLPGYSAYVLDEAMNEVPSGVAGELYIGGPAVARGYRNLPDLTGERFVPDPFGLDDDRLYRTFDQVRRGETGELYFLGRLDDQIKIRGFRIELSEIEAVLVEHADIKAAAVRVVEITGMKELAAYVVAENDGHDLDRRALSEALRLRLPAYMVPQFLDVVGDLPMLASGKIDRKALPAPVRLLVEVGTVVPPANDLERAIVEAWKQTLGLPEISVLSDFFLDLGGHSLTAAQTATLIRKGTGRTCVSVRDIYALRTVRALAQHMRAFEPAPDANSEVAGQATVTHQPVHSHIGPYFQVGALQRFLTVATQAVAIIAYYGLVASPLAFATLMVTGVVDGRIDWVDAAAVATAVGFATWPVMLFTSIAVKWLVIGRYKAGRYRVGSAYYLRWWLASRFQSLSWSKMFTGTPLMSLYWRAMGAKVGRNVTLGTPYCTAFDMVSVGDNSSVGVETQMLGYRVENGFLIIAPVSIGRDCFVGMHCALGLGSSMGDGARLDDMSLLPDGIAMAPGDARRGVPALPANVEVPASLEGADGSNPAIVRALFGAAHFGLLYVMSWFLMAAGTPTAVLILGALYLGGPAWGIAAAYVAIPVSIATFIFSAALLKAMLGRQEAGTIPTRSFAYLRHWFTSFLLDNVRSYLLPIFGTVYSGALMRLFGAKVGRGVEVSTVMHVSPDLLEVGDGSFLADACLVGGERMHGGLVNVGTVRIGAKSFVGNSALVAGGSSIGDGVLIGVCSTLPDHETAVANDTRWLGSPGFELPTKQTSVCFADEQVFSPGRRAKLERSIIDMGRILLPSVIGVTCGIALVVFLVVAFHALPLLTVVAMVPFVATLLAISAVLASALVKGLFIGRLQPTVKPLWSRYVWRNELVNGVYENVAATAMLPLMGTPFIAPCLRLMGCKVGSGCFIETTLFSEFDLVEIGDRVNLNLGTTVQTHLFEDRVFKSDRLTIGDGCSTGNMSVVLYGSEMKPGAVLGPLSVLMKGETLPERTHWHGVPCERVTPLAR